MFFSAVPQASEFLDPQPLSKGKTEKKNKKKGSDKASTSQLDTGFITLPAPMSRDSPMPGTSTSASPAPRPGFSRITSTAVEFDSPRPGGTPVPSERSKVVFGLGKRKADDEATGTPPPKRR